MPSIVKQEETYINPEICKKCRCMWQFVIYRDSIFEKAGKEYIQSFFCVNENLRDAFGGYLKQISLSVRSLDKFRENQSLFLESYKNGYKETYKSDVHSIITLKVDKINKKLKEACKNVIIFKTQHCPYYFEHKLSEWNQK